MGIVKKIFGAILGLFAGLAGLVGLGNKGGDYYLDLSEGGAQAPAQVAKAEVPKAASPAATPVSKGAVAKKETAKQEAVAPAPVAAPEPLSFAEIMATPMPTMSRRRPGPSLNAFKDMAKDLARKA